MSQSALNQAKIDQLKQRFDSFRAQEKTPELAKSSKDQTRAKRLKKFTRGLERGKERDQGLGD